MIIEWLYRNVRVPKDSVVKVLDGMDADRDGYISLGELVQAVKRVR